MSIAIDSEDDAWRTLSQLANGELDTASVDELEFGDWVKLRVYIHEKRYDSALNTYMMQGWQDAQRALYRSYAITAKGAADARSLTDSEREKLDVGGAGCRRSGGHFKELGNDAEEATEGCAA